MKNTPAPKIQHAGVLSGQLTGTSNPSIFLPWKEGAGPKQYTEDFLHKMNLWHTLPHRPATSIDSISPASVLRLDPLLEPLLWLSQMSKGDDLKARKDIGTKGKVGTKVNKEKKIRMKRDTNFRTRFHTDLLREVDICPLGPIC